MEKELTQEQKEALRFDRHIALTANAGSGKTSVLQQRYVDILLKDEKKPDPRNVVAITFTREAASEILNKISQNIENKIENESRLTEKMKLERIRAKLNTAPISTIHSFCSALLRQFPIETNIPPNFGELTEIEKKEIYSNSTIQALEEWLDKEVIERSTRIRNFISVFGMQRLENGIKYLLSKRERFELLKKYYEENNVESFILKRDEIIFNKIYNNCIPAFNKVTELIDKLSGKNSKKFSTLSLINNKIANIYQQLENISSGSPVIVTIENLINEIKEILKFLFDEKIIKKECSLYLPTVKKILEEDEITYFNQYLILLKEVNDICDSFKYNAKDKELFDDAKLLIEITSDVIDIINDEKVVRAGLDFDDQLIKTSELLNDDYAVEKIRRKLKYIMIDEFQDTNDLQYDIVKKLLPELKGKELKGKLNFYIVGDEKQSIYGFRNADVRVFEKAKKDIAETNEREKNLTVDKKEDFGNLNLTITFRLAPVPAAFVNKVCGKLFEKKESEFDVEYSPLVCSKKISEIIENENINTEIDLTEKNFGNVTFLINDYINTNSDEYVEISESKTLAIYIKSFAIDNKKKWSDFGILGRTRKGFDELISALQQQDIPYILHAGKGFYNSPEVVDLCSILSFLHNPDDNKSIAATLRSPFFNISDNGLYKISKLKTGNSFWSKFKEYCSNIENKINRSERADEEEDNCLRAMKILTELYHRAARISIPQLIHKIIDMCCWYSFISGLPSENQMRANVNKLIQIARDFEKRGFKNLYDFVEQVKGTISADLSESEAVFLSDENAVNIMTIHSSKGLEFDTVCLYNSSESYSKDSPFLLDDNLGLTFRMRIKDEMSNIDKEIITPVYYLASEKQNEAEKAESKRLLYVALTRAENNVIISGSINKKGQKGYNESFFKMILNSLDMEPENFENLKEISFYDILKCYYNNKFYDLRIKFPVSFAFNFSDNKYLDFENKVKEHQEKTVLLNKVSSQFDNEIFSATKLMTYHNNPDEYVRRYLFGLPSAEDSEFNSIHLIENSKEDDVIGTYAGTLIHSVLERIKDWLQSDGVADEKTLNNVIETVCRNANRKIGRKLFDRIHDECRQVANTTLIKLYTNLFNESISEQTMQIIYKNEILLVKTDLLIKNASGEWEIWDWKTNRIESIDKKNELIKYYELQMKIYVFFLMKLYPEQQNFRARLLFTRLAKNGNNDENWFHVYIWNKRDFDNIEIEIQKLVDEVRTKQN
ncbi:MAG: hypothetical protein EPN82_08555 [Bacteroidetes bacterium]|nr:MAG: hypothetical protein EPN82_08555 [Bacteroidota bacterium]